MKISMKISMASEGFIEGSSAGFNEGSTGEGSIEGFNEGSTGQ